MPKKQALVQEKLSELNLADSVTYRMFPVSKNKILVRFENLADKMDHNQPSDTIRYIDLESFAQSLYQDVNHKKAHAVNIQEMDLQGVNPIEKKNKEWWSVEDKKNNVDKLKSLAQDKSGFKGIALEPMRLRTF